MSAATMTLQDRWSHVFMSNYGTPTIELVKGSGSQVWDADGNQYLDLLAGIAVSSLGHAHPAIVDAVAQQVATLTHTSNLYANEPALRLAEKLTALVGHDSRVFLCNDGATANEAAFKMARRHGRNLDPEGGRLEIVAAHGAFHGRTAAALAMTGQPAKRDPFVPLPGPVTFIPFGDVDALTAAVTSSTAAVILEPVLGEGGVITPPEGYLAAARAACDAVGALLIVDEVQSGIGRTGAWFDSLSQGVVPDVITLAKGLGGGLPIGACIGLGDAADLLQPGDHGSTFGGNPVSCAAALAVLDTIESDGLLDHVTAVGAYLASGIGAVDHPALGTVRGRGLWLAFTLNGVSSARVEAAARNAGFLINAVAPDAIRLAPPLVLTEAEAQTFIDALPAILDQAGAA